MAFEGEEVNQPIVFVIDDDAACRDSVHELVSAAGLVAVVFSSAVEFLTAFDSTWRGCLVLDLYMRQMNGRALQERLHASMCRRIGSSMGQIRRSNERVSRRWMGRSVGRRLLSGFMR